jgi:hypothetical protein
MKLADEIKYYEKLFSFQRNVSDINIEDIIRYTKLKAELKKQEEWEIIPRFKWLQRSMFDNNYSYFDQLFDYIYDYFFEESEGKVI